MSQISANLYNNNDNNNNKNYNKSCRAQQSFS